MSKIYIIDETTTEGGGNSGIAGLYTWGSGDDGDVVFDNIQVIGYQTNGCKPPIA